MLFNKSFKLPAEALEIQILDRRGQVLWHQQRKRNAVDTIQWNGRDSQGRELGMGDYICKMVYRDGRSAYIPFILA